MALKGAATKSSKTMGNAVPQQWSNNVLINGLGAINTSHGWVGPLGVEFVETGSTTVKINGYNAGRYNDRMKNASGMPLADYVTVNLSTNVFIGP